MKKRRLTKVGRVLIGVIAASLIFMMFWMIRPLLSEKAIVTKFTPTAETTAAPLASPEVTEDAAFAAEYFQNKQINPEYIGKMTFESGIIEQNLTQGTDNEKYLNTAWDGTANHVGAAYLDYRNVLSDQNLIFYGHYHYDDPAAMFTPLERLIDQSGYQANKYIDIKFSGTDIRRYVITDVFYYEMNSDTLKYYKPNYDGDFFITYYMAVKQADFYDTGETLTMNDHWISLQTCVRNHDELREIVLAKQITQ